jgi:hypothetical protein
MTDREKAELYDHMEEVAKANGFDSLTEAIVEANSYKTLLWKYLNCVGVEESVTYWQRSWCKERFTPVELEALAEIERMDAPEWAK